MSKKIYLCTNNFYTLFGTVSLLFSILPKKGTSNTKERIELVQRYVRLFGAESIDCLLADREFVGEHWVKWLNDSSILKHGRKTKSIFRYGLDIVTEFLLRGRNEYKIPIFASLQLLIKYLHPTEIFVIY